MPIYGSGGFTTLTDAQLDEQVALVAVSRLHRDEDQDRRSVGHPHRPRPGAGRPAARTRRQCHRTDGRRQRRLQHRPGPPRRRTPSTTWASPGSKNPSAATTPPASRLLRAALRCDIAAGEYAADLYDVRALLPVVDCLQLDATRCGGYTGWLRGAALAAAHNLQVSAHCAPSLHAPVAAAVPNLRHVEWFVDHARLEPLLVDGLPEARGGALQLDASYARTRHEHPQRRRAMVRRMSPNTAPRATRD